MQLSLLDIVAVLFENNEGLPSSPQATKLTSIAPPPSRLDLDGSHCVIHAVSNLTQCLVSDFGELTFLLAQGAPSGMMTHPNRHDTHSFRASITFFLHS